MSIRSVRGVPRLFVVAILFLATACSLQGRPREVQVPDDLIGTWRFFNPRGDDEQMAVFPGGRVALIDGAGRIEERFYTEGFMERMDEYASNGIRLRSIGDDLMVQYADTSASAKTWRRVDPVPTTFPLPQLSESPASALSP